ncbi:hypothetical protein IAR55_001159 [Kwoniella newhampshirensis]|uniref:Uncharacterized protein n=1 Tax=Kwoniella newhampshirensis TaxID=1651941 RepID=A0AAW0Z4T9_9TREE
MAPKTSNTAKASKPPAKRSTKRIYPVSSDDDEEILEGTERSANSTPRQGGKGGRGGRGGKVAPGRRRARVVDSSPKGFVDDDDEDEDEEGSSHKLRPDRPRRKQPPNRRLPKSF